jgi:hypothetical protein
MTGDTWRALYASEAQGVWSLWVVPALFLAYLAAAAREPATSLEPRAHRFLRAYAIVFALETMLDPFAGGPLLRWLGLADGPLRTIVMVFFVLVGDFRVFLLVLGIAASAHGATPALPRLVVEAGRWTLVVPLVAVASHGALAAVAGPLPAQSIWLVYELAFVAMALVWRQRIVPARVPAERPDVRAYLRAVLSYVLVYYALWALADVCILAADLDAGWALRIVPNQLYYALYLPFVWALFVSPRYAVASTSAQTSR